MRLTNERYEEIKETICDFLCDYDVDKLPIDVFELANKMKVKIVRSSELIQKYPKKINEYQIFSFPPSYLFYDSKEQRFLIFLDDYGIKIKRQRFSIAHEIMHIILGHTEQSPRNETEANFGATYLLAPTSLALIEGAFTPLTDPIIVMDIFDVSFSEAEIVVRYFENRFFCNSDYKSYEKEINRRFGKSFCEKLNNYK